MTDEQKILDKLDKSIAALRDLITEANNLNIDIDLTIDQIRTFGSMYKQYNISLGASKILRTPIPYVTYTGGF